LHVHVYGAVVVETLFSKAVESIYRAASDPAHWPYALQAMADVFDDVGAVMVYQRETGEFGAVGSPGLQRVLEEYGRDFKGQDLRAIRGVERGYYLNHEGCTDKDLVTPEEMETHPFYKLLARHGLKYFAAAMVSPDTRVNVSIAVQRAITKEPYSEAELDCMVRLGKHAENALRLSIRLLDAELANVGLQEALSRLGIGVFALDTLGRIVFFNSEGERLLGDGLIVVDDRLRVAPSATRNAIEREIAQVLSGQVWATSAAPKPFVVERAKAARSLTVYVLPIARERTVAHEFLTHARALVLVIDPGGHGPPDPSVVRDVLGLTLSEARVAALVGSGLGPAEAADRLGIAEETARTALKRVFSKVGVSRQNELSALLTRLTLR
jgi:DNA-binding CsgD family transcriptional regulator